MSSGQRRYLPISLDVADRRVLVAGNGSAALRKLELLTRTSARLTLFAPAPHLDLVLHAASHGVEHVLAYPTAHDLTDAALILVATGDDALDRQISDLACEARVAVNVVDRPHLSTVSMPALVDRGALTVAIASDGAAPVLAQRVRALIDALLPPTLVNLGTLARSVRSAVLARLPGHAERRRFWWRLLDGEAGAAALSGNLDRARALALADLHGAVEARPGPVPVISAGGPADLLTLRAQRQLLCADIIVHDASVGSDVLDLGRRDAQRIAVTGAAQAEALVARLSGEGKQVVRVITAALGVAESKAA